MANQLHPGVLTNSSGASNFSIPRYADLVWEVDPADGSFLRLYSAYVEIGVWGYVIPRAGSNPTD